MMQCIHLQCRICSGLADAVRELWDLSDDMAVMAFTRWRSV